MPVALALAAALAVTDWIGVATRRRRLRLVGKPGTMVALIVAALLVDGAPADVRGWFVAALVLSLVGDVALMAPEQWFVAGLGAFLLAHVAYVAGMLAYGVELRPLLLGAALAVVAAATVGRRIVRGAHLTDPGLRIPVMGYVVVISAMVATAVGTTEPLLIVAATLFYCSDALLGWDRFVEPHPWAGLAVMITYHLAQFGFVVWLATL